MSRKVDSITITLLFSIVFFLGILFYLNEKSKNEQNYSQYHNKLETLKGLQKDFDAFIYSSLNFTNYDNISAQLLEFDTILEELQRSDISDIYSMKLQEELQKISNAYETQSDILEYNKSLNAMIVNSIHYLYDLRESILETEEADEILFLLMQLFSGLEEQKELLGTLLKNIPDGDNIDVTLFYKHSKILLSNIQNLEEPLLEYKELNMENKIITTMLTLEQSNALKSKRYQQLNLFFILGVIILLSILIFLYQKSLRQKEQMQLASTVFDNTEEGIVVTDVNQKIISVNKAFENILGYTSEECQGLTPKIFQSQNHEAHFYKKCGQK